MFRTAFCFAIGPVTLLWWAGNPTPNPITRPTRLLGALAVGSRRPPSVRFEAPSSPLPFKDALATFVVLCSIKAAASERLCLHFSWRNCLPSVVAGVSKPRCAFSFYPLPLFVAFTPEFISPSYGMPSSFSLTSQPFYVLPYRTAALRS